jgi:Chalcone isomerase-like
MPTLASAVKVGNVELPDTWLHEKETLVLNGAGMREYGFLRIAVYAGALYLPKRETNANAVLEAMTPRVIHMKMLRNVSREDSVKAWTHYLEANCTLPCVKDSEPFKASLQIFERLVPDTQAGDTQTFVFKNGTAEWLRNGITLGDIRDVNFTRAWLASWIGSVPTTKNLRGALLGTPRQ